MALLQLFQSFDLRSPPFWSYTAVTADKTGFSIVDGVHRQVFIGDFTASGDSLAGRVTATSYLRDGVEIYRVTGLDTDVAVLIDLIENNNVAQAYALVLAGADAVTGSSGADVLPGYNGDDSLSAGGGADLLVGMAGNDRLDGGSGLDTAEYMNIRAAYSVARTDTGFRVSTTGIEGSDMLYGVERLRFADGAVALDTGRDGIAGQAYRLYLATFNRTPDEAGAGFWVAAMDKGMPLVDVARQFIESNEYRATYGSALSHTELVTRYYTNILDRAPEQAGLDFWVKVLDGGAPVAQVLAAISDSGEHIAVTAALVANGFAYTPYG